MEKKNVLSLDTITMHLHPTGSPTFDIELAAVYKPEHWRQYSDNLLLILCCDSFRSVRLHQDHITGRTFTLSHAWKNRKSKTSVMKNRPSNVPQTRNEEKNA